MRLRASLSYSVTFCKAWTHHFSSVRGAFHLHVCGHVCIFVCVCARLIQIAYQHVTHNSQQVLGTAEIENEIGPISYLQINSTLPLIWNHLLQKLNSSPPR